MGSRTQMRKCEVCRRHSTRSNAGICHRCKAMPDVRLAGEKVYIDGLGHMSIDRALRLAHAIADAVTP